MVAGFLCEPTFFALSHSTRVLPNLCETYELPDSFNQHGLLEHAKIFATTDQHMQTLHFYSAHLEGEIFFFLGPSFCKDPSTNIF